MKKYILILAMICSGSVAVRAQDDLPADPEKKQEKIQALYVAYITQQLQLNPEEAQKFWPIHTQLTAELKGVKPDMPELEKQQAILNIKKKYQDNFNKVLGPNRCERFFRMDGEFKRKLLEKVRNQGMRQRPGGFRRPQ
jgi:hypothetical protein